MKYEEIEALLEMHNHQSTLASLRRAVRSERDALAVLQDEDDGIDWMARARGYFAEDVTRWLEHGGCLRPDDVLSHRPRYAESWAIAMVVRAIRDQEVQESDADRQVRNVLRDLSWVFQTIHNAFHPHGTWMECSVGVCASAEDIFFRAGFTKTLEKRS